MAVMAWLLEFCGGATRWVAVGVAGLFILSGGQAASAQASRCNIALVLALDVSGSVNWKEFRLQSNGTADAFEDPEVLQLLSYYQGGVMVSLMQWSAAGYQQVFVDWTVIRSDADAIAFARRVRDIGRGPSSMTATGSALLFGQSLFAQAPMVCDRNVIDVSTDGLSNRGPDLYQTADHVAALGTTINALVIYDESPTLENYFRINLIRGPGAFTVAIATYADYPDAIKRKLLRELQPTISMLDK